MEVAFMDVAPTNCAGSDAESVFQCPYELPEYASFETHTQVEFVPIDAHQSIDHLILRKCTTFRVVPSLGFSTNDHELVLLRCVSPRRIHQQGRRERKVFSVVLQTGSSGVDITPETGQRDRSYDWPSKYKTQSARSRWVTMFNCFSYNFCWPVETFRERNAEGPWRRRTPRR